ncbi:putative hydrolase of the HAD superfamily [Limimonas halophila]|uniref:Putative hydrolase of the HAD superfamily n=1 Tax=Limimonas halophila TaxID=1082479 RepID=A0A1G7LJF6_9PROT|nr:HAD family hydrolase [Limimonas halophila]SDF49581.1 putative hydrolase of the HAD superfamily [Limimonas halophila]
MLTTLTFDLWDTLVTDDSDEPKRAARGLGSKRDTRRQLVHDALAAEGWTVERGEIDRAYDVADAAFQHCWKGYSVTWPLDERLRVLLRGMGASLAPAAFDRLLHETARMEVEIPPDPLPGVHAALDELAAHYKLAIASDAIFTPGAQLREMLARHGLDRYFSTFAFSDEIGRSKPHAAMFDHIAEATGSDFPGMLHVGDRQHNDVAGPQQLGMKAVLFVGARSKDRPGTTADAICENLSELPGIVRALDAAPVTE